MGQELSHTAASQQLEADLGIKGPFFAPSAENASQSMQRIVCLVCFLNLITFCNTIVHVRLFPPFPSSLLKKSAIYIVQCFRWLFYHRSNC